MPASSQGLPTSGMRLALPLHSGIADFYQIDPGAMRRVSFKLIPAGDCTFDFNSSALPMTSNAEHSRQTQIGKASPQKRFLEIIQSPIFFSQSNSRCKPNSGIQ